MGKFCDAVCFFEKNCVEVYESVIWLLPQALKEAEQELQKERTELDSLLISQSKAASNPKQDSDEGEEEGLFRVQCDWQMASIIQSALFKREEVVALLAEKWAVISVLFQENVIKEYCGSEWTVTVDNVFRLRETTSNSQAMEDLKEQMGLKRLYTNCDQVWIYHAFFPMLYSTHAE